MLYNPCTKGLCVAWRARACSLLQAIQRLAQPELITDNSHLTPPMTVILSHPLPTQTLLNRNLQSPGVDNRLCIQYMLHVHTAWNATWQHKLFFAFFLCDTTLQNDVSLSGNGLRTRRGWRRASGAYLYVLIS